MLPVVIAALLSTLAASPTPAPTGAAAELLRAVDEIERRAKDDPQRAFLLEARQALRTSAADHPLPPAELARLAEGLADLQPDNELVHLAAVQALLEASSATGAPASLAGRTRARAAAFVARNPTSVKGQDLLATVLLAQGDEEGQLRALFACGTGCRARFLEAVRIWQRPRCSGEGVARGLTLRMGKHILAVAEDVVFLEPVPTVAATPATFREPERPEVPGLCLVQLDDDAAVRFAARTAGLSPATAETLIVLNGLMLVSDERLTGPVTRGLVKAPVVACDSLCLAPRPRALPAGVTADLAL